ncbi:MAG: Gfo/Idh/MocA family oxidoreductase [Phycisphaerae bacterium]|nr:Gfo/Idh/MocA family oxidoreductase [Phycisphaerae bacterium]
MKKKNISRRELIKSTVAASAVLSVPTIVSSTVFGAGAPSNRVNVGQIGCGSIGNWMHKNNLKKLEDVRVVATCDAFKSRRDEMAAFFNKHYGGKNITKPYADFRELLASKDVDAVIVAAHDNWHTPMSIAAANAGKDVYCQKPLSLDLGRTKLLRKAVNDNKRVFQFGTQYRSEQRYRQMVELVRNGYIGELKHIDVWCRNVHHDAAQYNVKPYGSTVEIPVPADFNFDAWQGPSDMAPYTSDRCTRWGGFHCPETSLGFLAGCGIHPLGVAQWGNKTDHTSPVKYKGTGKVPTEGIFRTLEIWDVMCEYENGVTLRVMDHHTAKGAVKESYPDLPLDWKDGDGVVFKGTKGWIGDFRGPTFYASDQKLWNLEFKPTDERVYLSSNHHRNFIDCVKSTKETVCPVEMGIRCDTIAHMVNTAAQTGREITWDPKTEQIVGDAEAAKMITRPYRKKWKVW